LIVFRPNGGFSEELACRCRGVAVGEGEAAVLAAFQVDIVADILQQCLVEGAEDLRREQRVVVQFTRHRVVVGEALRRVLVGHAVEADVSIHQPRALLLRVFPRLAPTALLEALGAAHQPYEPYESYEPYGPYKPNLPYGSYLSHSIFNRDE